MREYRGGGRKRNPKEKTDNTKERVKELREKVNSQRRNAQKKNKCLLGKSFRPSKESPQKKGMKANINPKYQICNRYNNDYYLGGW